MNGTSLSSGVGVLGTEWIEAVLSPRVEVVHSLDNTEALLALCGVCEGSRLIVSVEPNEAATLELVRELRFSGSMPHRDIAFQSTRGQYS